jgi:hypothetical protein
MSDAAPKVDGYVKLGTVSYVYAYLIVISLVLTAIMMVFMIMELPTANSIVVGGLGLFLVYIQYNIAAHAINCDNLMDGKEAPLTSSTI